MERFFEENSTDKAVIYRMNRNVAHYHLPGLFEFIELYRVFLPLYREHREYLYMVHRRIVSGAEDVSASGTMTRRRFWN